MGIVLALQRAHLYHNRGVDSNVYFFGNICVIKIEVWLR